MNNFLIDNKLCVNKYFLVEINYAKNQMVTI